ncbi:hypothetical protein PISL3812_07702 [Talaromyces islandicus]|uniref:Uncharacterized protein n=1 Tax=Talaromyces islandicus TaxID=28573 RepID=A0A0U1M4W4_TALIS|nr:hypothetical protein PISL3812_07702 [Talaromyces islandicus]
MRPVGFPREAQVSFHYARSFLTTGRGRRFASVSAAPPHPVAFELPDDNAQYDQQIDILRAFKRSNTSKLAVFLRHQLAARLMSYDQEKQMKMDLNERKEILYAAFKKRQPDQILALMGDIHNRPIIEQMPDSVFVSAFLFLTPEHFIEPYKKILGRVHDHALRVKGYGSFNTIMKQYLTDLFLIFRIRSSGDSKLGLAEHTLLLRWAASVGDLSIALHTWASMQRNNIQPNMECYNLLLATSLWDRVNAGKERYRLTVTRFYMSKRRKGPRKRKLGYRGFGVRANSVRVPVQLIIRHMQQLEIPADESTYANMLLAYARVGYPGGIKLILQSIWGIDVDKLADETEIHPPARAYSPSSPLYPSKDLLWTIAHAFGICSDLPSALRAVQFMSEQYNVKISPDAWLELFERAYVLSKKPFNKNKLTSPAPMAVVPFSVVHKIYEMMGPAPTHSRMHVFRKLARMASKRKILREYSDALGTAYNFLHETRRKRQQALLILEKSLGFQLKIDPLNTPFDEAKVRSACESTEVWKALREYEILRLEVMQQRLKIERIVALGVGTGRWKELGDHTTWDRQRLPEFLAEWKDFLPECFYVTLSHNGGKLEFHGRTTYLHQNIRPHHHEPVRRSRWGELLDGEELEHMDDYLWSHIKERLGPLAQEQPFAGFFARNWSRMDAPGDNFLWIAEQEMKPLEEPREKKFTRTFPDTFWERMEQSRNWDEESGLSELVDVRPLIEKEMRDGSYHVELAPFGRWY